MKGLLIKDIAYLKQNKSLYFFLIIFGLGFSLFYDNSNFILGYCSVFSGILALGTINYDDYNHGLSFLFTLPPTRKDYVKEKYLLAYGISVVLIIFATILSIATDYRLLHNFHFISLDWLLGILATLFFSFMLIAFLIPIQIKFGSQKSQLAMIIVFGGMALVFILLYLLTQVTGIDIESLFNQIISLSPYLIMTIFILIVALINYVSYRISITMMEKKEF